MEMEPSLWLEFVENVIAFGGWIVAFASAILSLYFFAKTQARENEVRTATSYMQLELASNDIFRFTAHHTKDFVHLRGESPTLGPDDKDYAVATDVLRNLYYQTLNLFEVCSRLRRDAVVPPTVFASWVAWFVELLDDKFFREEWEDIRGNYTDDVRIIMDVGVDLYARYPRDEFEDVFYTAVAHIMGKDPKRLAAKARPQLEPGPCREIAEWRNKKRLIWDVANRRLVEAASAGSPTPTPPAPPPASPPA